VVEHYFAVLEVIYYLDAEDGAVVYLVLLVWLLAWLLGRPEA